MFPETIFQDMDDRQAGQYVYTKYLPILETLVARWLGRRDPVLAEELAHGFLATKVCGPHGLMTIYDPAKGKFRWLLWRAFHNYVTDWLRRQTAESPLEVDDLPAHNNVVHESQLDWVHCIWEFSIVRFEETCDSTTRRLFQRYTLDPIQTGEAPPTLKELAHEFGATEGQVTGRIARGREFFRTILRDVIREVGRCHADTEVDDEYRAIQKALANPEFLKLLAGRCSHPPLHASSEYSSETSSVTQSISELLMPPTSVTLDQLLNDDLRSIRFDRKGLVAQAATELPSHISTLGDVFVIHQTHQRTPPPLGLLNAIKRVLKPYANRNETHLAQEHAKILYCAVISAGIVGHGEHGLQTLTSLSKDVVLQNFRSVLRRGSLPTELRTTISEAVDSLCAK